MESTIHYYDRTVKNDRPLARNAMAREGHLWTVSTKYFGQAQRDFCVCVLTSQPSTELCQFCTIDLYLSF